MPAPLSYKNDEEQDKRLDPFDSDYTSRGLDDAENFANENSSGDFDNSSSASDNVNDFEESAPRRNNQFGFEKSKTSKSSTSSASGTHESTGRFSRVKAVFKGNWKKKGAGIGVLGGVGVGGFALLSFFGPASLLVSLGQNLFSHNDTSSVAMERRMAKIFGNMIGSDGGVCASSKKSIKCKFGKVSNNALRTLNNRAGIIALDESGKEIKKKRLGYPKKNPSTYRIPDVLGKGKVNGKKVTVTNGYKDIKAKDLMGFLSQPENRNVAAQVLGKRGAFNLRVKSAMGKFLKKRVFDKFNIKRDGGNANGKHKNLADLKKNQRNKPDPDRLKKNVDGVSEKAGKRARGFGKAGIAYQVVAGSCLALKLPAWFAGAVAAYQLAVVMPVAMDAVLSPSTKAQGSGIDQENALTPEEANVAGSALTDRTDNGNNQMTSALDSQYLLSAIGANTGKPPVSKDITPGYAFLVSGIVQASNKVKHLTSTECNAILSPAVMYSFMAGDIALTIGVSAATAGLGGVAKKSLDFIAGFIGTELLIQGGKLAAPKVISWVAKNEVIPKATGEKFGDIVGIGAMSFFSTTATSRGLPVLKESEVAAYEKIRQDSEENQRQYDIASLSPFDTSSQYTFLGSLVNNANMSFIKNSSSMSSIASVIKTPLTMLSNIVNTHAGAAYDSAKSYCSYAKDFKMDTDKDSPAINASGMPCTGITPTQAGMSTSTAIELLSNEGWLDGDADVKDGATIDDLLEDGIIKGSETSPNPLYSFVNDCTKVAENGTYLLDSPGCTVQGAGGKGSKDLRDNVDLKDPRSLEAITPFLIDFQLTQSMNGDDEEEDTAEKAGEDISDDATGTVSGTAKELAQKLLDYSKKGRVMFWDQARDKNDKSRPSDNLRSLAAGELAHTSTRGPAGGKKTEVDVKLLQFLVDLAGETPIRINALVGQAHSRTSNHYSGNAVDLGCNETPNLNVIADKIGKKYGISHNNENCSAEGGHHWHYSTNGR